MNTEPGTNGQTDVMLGVSLGMLAGAALGGLIGVLLVDKKRREKIVDTYIPVRNHLRGFLKEVDHLTRENKTKPPKLTDSIQ